MDNTITLKPDSFISRELSLSRRPFPAMLAVLAVLAIAGAIGAEEPSARPLAWKTLPPSYKASFTEYSGFSTVGRIYEINRAASNVAVISDKPFWSPQPGVGNRVALWPAHTLLMLRIAAVAPITLDGKKAGFAQFAIGQTVSVQYSIFSGGFCAARRIEARTH